MRLLLDTQLLLRLAGSAQRLSTAALSLIDDETNLLAYSVVSIWEMTIKAGLGRDDFIVDPRRLRLNLLEAGYRELDVTAAHALAVGDLPLLHRDPFDRLLVAQAVQEGMDFVTTDRTLARYPVSIRVV